MKGRPESGLRRLALAALFGLGARAALATDALRIEDAWLREPPPGQQVAALYMRLDNAGAAAVHIGGIRVDGAEGAAIHQSVEREGMMRMLAVPDLAVPAGGSVSLAPGGYHAMVFGLKATPRAGERVRFCLLPVAGAKVCAQARVRGLQE